MITFTPKTVFTSVVSSALAVTVPDISTSIGNPALLIDVQTSGMNTISPPSNEGSRRTLVELEPLNSGWSAARNTRFKQLARVEALRDLSDSEYAELEMLTSLRRADNHPRSSDEILWERRQRKLTRSLVTALEEYVEFHEGASHP